MYFYNYALFMEKKTDKTINDGILIFFSIKIRIMKTERVGLTFLKLKLER